MLRGTRNGQNNRGVTTPKPTTTSSQSTPIHSNLTPKEPVVVGYQPLKTQINAGLGDHTLTLVEEHALKKTLMTLGYLLKDLPHLETDPTLSSKQPMLSSPRFFEPAPASPELKSIAPTSNDAMPSRSNGSDYYAQLLPPTFFQSPLAHGIDVGTQSTTAKTQLQSNMTQMETALSSLLSL